MNHIEPSGDVSPNEQQNDPRDICQFDLLGQQLADHLLT